MMDRAWPLSALINEATLLAKTQIKETIMKKAYLFNIVSTGRGTKSSSDTTLKFIFGDLSWGFNFKRKKTCCAMISCWVLAKSCQLPSGFFTLQTDKLSALCGIFLKKSRYQASSFSFPKHETPGKHLRDNCLNILKIKMRDTRISSAHL